MAVEAAPARWSASRARPVLVRWRRVRTVTTGWLADHGLTVAAFAMIDTGAFVGNTIAGFVVSGLSLLALDWKTDGGD